MDIKSVNYQSLIYLFQEEGSHTFRHWIKFRRNSDISAYTHLSCSALAGFDISEGLRKELLRLKDSLKIDDIFNLLKHGYTNNTNKRLWSTQTKRDDLCIACLRFLDMENLYRYNFRPLSDRIAWIIPDRKFCDDGRIDSDFERELELDLCNYFNQDLEDWRDWLPWMSLTTSTKLRKWRSNKLRCIERALIKLPNTLGITSDVYFPWNKEYPKNLAELPIPTLYQCEQDSKTLDVILSLTGIGLKKVNDLRIFHPRAIQFAKDFRTPHKEFYIKYNSG